MVTVVIDEKLLEQMSDRTDEGLHAHLEQIAVLSSRLPSLTESLEATNQGVDKEFVGIGASLQSAFVQAQQLASDVTEATGLMSKHSEENWLNQAGEMARSSLTALQRDQEKTSRRLRHVELMSDRLADLHPWSAMLGRIARRLRAISICFAVEGSRSPELSAMFEAFTGELRQLADWVLDIASSIGVDSRASEEQQKSAKLLISEESSQLRLLSDDAEQAVSSAISNIEHIVKLSVSALASIAEHSQRLSQWVGRAVVAIQFRDITRQQTEHVVEALRDAELFSGEQAFTTSGGGPAFNTMLGRTFSVLRLQAAQMQSVIDSISRAHEDIELAFQEIAQESGEIGAAVTGLITDSLNESASADPFEALQRALQELCQLLDREHSLSDRAMEAAGYASSASTMLSQYVTKVDDLNSELELKALNATIKSVRLGDTGRAISVLAEEVMTLSRTCNGFVASMATAIGAITTLTKELGEECEDEDGGPSNPCCLNEGVKAIAERYAQFLASASAASSKAQKLQEMIGTARAELEFLPKLVQKLEDYRSGIEAMIEALQPWAAYADAEDAAIGQHTSRYTMEHEREIHAQALLGGSPATRTTTAAGKSGLECADGGRVSAVDADEDLGDNFELF